MHILETGCELFCTCMYCLWKSNRNTEASWSDFWRRSSSFIALDSFIRNTKQSSLRRLWPLALRSGAASVIVGISWHGTTQMPIKPSFFWLYKPTTRIPPSVRIVSSLRVLTREQYFYAFICMIIGICLHFELVTEILTVPLLFIQHYGKPFGTNVGVYSR